MELPVNVRLSSVYCHDEADGIGNAEPYLWTIFFKIDGETIKQNGISLTGDAVFHFGPGSHENLRTHAVEDDDSVAIPATLGEWNTKLQPIIIKDASDHTHLIPGTIGVAAILMEEDNVSDSGAEAGHQALNNYIRNSINEFIHSISLLDFVGVDKPEEKLKELTDALVKEIKDKSSGKVKDAIRNKQPWYNDAWAFLNADDNIGSEIWMYNQDEIVSHVYNVSLRQRWHNEGDWEIFGSITAPDPCKSQVVAVNQQNARIAGVQQQIASLRAEMVRKPAAFRAALQKEIDELNETIATLETELQRLRGLVSKCRLRQSITEGFHPGGAVVGHFDAVRPLESH